MSKHLQKDLDTIKKQLLIMGAMVEEALNKSINALNNRMGDLAQQVIEGDDAIDFLENDIQENCLKALALHQPVAVDLRFVVTVMKVNNDLERMGDTAVNIAERALYLINHEPLNTPIELNKMMKNVQVMVRESLDSLVNLNTELARKVCGDDDQVDNMNRHMFRDLQDTMQKDPSTIKRAMQIISISRHLERTADLATNIAEEVIFMVEGEIIKHRYNIFINQEKSDQSTH